MMAKSKAWHLLYCSTALALACAGSPVRAADAASAEGGADTGASASASPSTPEIVVTAQFRAQKLQDTPLAITAVNSAIL
ncbi:hypothetical protein ACSTJH_00045, partial [Vibrio parahaemolyticus]